MQLLLETSAYDACYLALAEQQDAVLVTADRRLAALAGRAELVS
jgi:predicted nucleic acid-binding protein